MKRKTSFDDTQLLVNNILHNFHLDEIIKHLTIRATNRIASITEYIDILNEYAKKDAFKSEIKDIKLKIKKSKIEYKKLLKIKKLIKDIEINLPNM